MLQIIASNIDAISALKDPRNVDFLISVKSKKKFAPRHVREGTPLIEYYLVCATLRTDHYLYDLLRGWVFGRNKNGTNFILGT